mgnify:CR=1 FL=1
MALQTPIPALFSDQLRELLPTEAEALLTSLDEEASVSVRLNRRKTETPPYLLEKLSLGLSLWASTWMGVLPSPLTHFGTQVSTMYRRLHRCSCAL